MLALRDDLRLALDRVAFAKKLGIVPDGWQRDLLHSTSDRILLNCSRQSGKSTMTAVMALHRALYHPDSLILCLAPALRQSQELFGKVADFYRDLGRPVAPQGERKLFLETRERLQDHHASGFGEDHQGILGCHALAGGRGQPGRRRPLLRHQAHACSLGWFTDDALYTV